MKISFAFAILCWFQQNWRRYYVIHTKPLPILHCLIKSGENWMAQPNTSERSQLQLWDKPLTWQRRLCMQMHGDERRMRSAIRVLIDWSDSGKFVADSCTWGATGKVTRRVWIPLREFAYRRTICDASIVSLARHSIRFCWLLFRQTTNFKLFINCQWISYVYSTLFKLLHFVWFDSSSSTFSEFNGMEILQFSFWFSPFNFFFPIQQLQWREWIKLN